MGTSIISAWKRPEEGRCAWIGVIWCKTVQEFADKLHELAANCTIYSLNAIQYINWSTICPQDCVILKRDFFLHRRPFLYFFPHLLHLWRLRQLNHIYLFLIRAIQGNKALLLSFVGSGDRLRLGSSWLIWQAKIPLVVRRLQKQGCHLAGFSTWEGSKWWFLTILMWNASAKGKTSPCQQ